MQYVLLGDIIMYLPFAEKQNVTRSLNQNLSQLYVTRVKRYSSPASSNEGASFERRSTLRFLSTEISPSASSRELTAYSVRVDPPVSQFQLDSRGILLVLSEPRGVVGCVDVIMTTGLDLIWFSRSEDNQGCCCIAVKALRPNLAYHWLSGSASYLKANTNPTSGTDCARIGSSICQLVNSNGEYAI
ncbi:hypothetical protein ABKN59_011077 [Abortiporus biennis]